MEFIQNIDFQIFKFIHFSTKNEFLDIILPYARNKSTWIPFYIFLVYYLRRQFPKTYWKIILIVLISVVASDFLCAKILKQVFDRVRPCHQFALEAWFSNFNLCSQTYSFPSCHATNHSCIAFLLFPFVSKSIRWFLCFWVLSIGFSQIYIGVHFPSDILGGIIIGSIIGKIVSTGLKSWLKI